MQINDLLKLATERKASDVHLKVGSHPILRIDGDLIPLVDQPRLTHEDTVAVASSMMKDRQKARFRENLETDIAYAVPGLGRFRCAVFQQRGSVGLVLRLIPVTVRPIADLALPMVIERIATEPRGLILCTGTTALESPRHSPR